MVKLKETGDDSLLADMNKTHDSDEANSQND